MNWPQLLSTHRLGSDRTPAPDPARSPFQIDYDRIVFSSAFRRLQDKTQVFPLAGNDYVRTRLTHSLEVASVGRSLGARVGAEICRRHGLEAQYHASDFGAIVSAAALAHDLGNPPFGHSGEDAIRHWFESAPTTAACRADGAQALSGAERTDLARFEGNAQGFRVITRLQMPDNPGLRLTCATLGAFTKYPRASAAPAANAETAGAAFPKGASTKKFGFFQSDAPAFAEVARSTGLHERVPGCCWSRHPLAFLVEAADDICYRLVDFEDGYRLGHLSWEEVRDQFVAVIGDDRAKTNAEAMRERKDGIAFLRAQAIGAAVGQVATLFLEQEAALLAGAWDAPLLDHIAATAPLREIVQRSQATIYATPRGVEIEAAGYEVLGGLLDAFFGAMDDVARRGKDDAWARSNKLLQLIPSQFLGPDRLPLATPYERLLAMADFVSGMTDSYAVSLYKRIRGISLPSQE